MDCRTGKMCKIIFCLQSSGWNLLINRDSKIDRWNSLLLDSYEQLWLAKRCNAMADGGFRLSDTMYWVGVLLRMWEGMCWYILMSNRSFVRLFALLLSTTPFKSCFPILHVLQDIYTSLTLSLSLSLSLYIYIYIYGAIEKEKTHCTEPMTWIS